MYPLCLDHGFRLEMKPASGFDKDFICQVTIKDINGRVHGSEYIDLELDHDREYEEVSTENGTLYAEVRGEEAVITGYEGEDTEITVPSEIAGKKVTEIGRSLIRAERVQEDHASRGNQNDRNIGFSWQRYRIGRDP